MITYLQLDENIKGANINGRVYIHRYSVAYMMGLIYTDSRNNSNIIRWSRLRDFINNSTEEFIEMYNGEEEIGFTDKNIPSSQGNRTSEIELTIPEYINSYMLYTISYHIQTETAKKFRFALTKQVIPFFKQNASPEQINSIPIMNKEAQLENSFKKDAPISIGQYRMDIINITINNIRNIANRAGINMSYNDVISEAFKILDNIVRYRTGGVSLNTLVYDMKNTKIREVGSYFDILDCVCFNTLLFDDMQYSLSELVVKINNECIETINKNIGTGKYSGSVVFIPIDENNIPFIGGEKDIVLEGDLTKLHKISNTYSFSEKDILNMIVGIKEIPSDLDMKVLHFEDPGKEVVKFASTSDIYTNPVYYKLK